MADMTQRRGWLPAYEGCAPLATMTAKINQIDAQARIKILAAVKVAGGLFIFSPVVSPNSDIGY